MSLILNGIGLPLEAEDGEIIAAAQKKLGIKPAQLVAGHVYKRSLDLRKGGLKAVYSVELELDRSLEERLLRRDPAGVRRRVEAEMPKPTGIARPRHRPVIVGFGPAGLFAAYVLAVNGYRPLVLERGAALEERDKKVADFFAGGPLDKDTSVQFGEGGAGAYSDGKLTCRINDPRSELVSKILLEHGAPADVFKTAKPHVGTDLLKGIVVAMRSKIRELGGEVRFNTRVEDLILKDGRLCGLRTSEGEIPCETAVLAVGHSARELFTQLFHRGVSLEPKAFSAGVRVEHLQEDIDRMLYGKFAGHPKLPKGEYSLYHHLADGHTCYSFCMCPGGEVVAAASEDGGVVTNGMSYHARAGRNANAAICVSVSPTDYGHNDPLAGFLFQRQLEQAAYRSAGGNFKAPAQLLGDFLAGTAGAEPGRVQPTYSRGIEMRDLHGVLPGFICDGLAEGMAAFGRKMRGFDAQDTLFTGVETRTSSPVRILRGENLDSLSVTGLIPCGEGAGYAGGIVSAAVDGIRAAEEIMGRWAPEVAL